MPEIPQGHVNTPKIWNGTCTWQEGVTPFGFYDSDPQFQEAAVRFSFFAARRLGWPIMDVELDSGSFFTCLEEAVTEYGNQVYQFKVRENYLAMEGGRADVVANNTIVEPTLQRLVEIAKNYGTEATVGGDITLHAGMLTLEPNKQDYDLEKWAVEQQGIEGGIEIRRIFYEAPPAILRYFDPYAGTGTGIQSLMDAFDFGSYSPGINFMLMPVSADLLKLQAIEFNDTVRKSSYSFEVHNNFLRIFPIPLQGGYLRIEFYSLADKKRLGLYDTSTSSTPVITNVSEVPYVNPEYSKINSVGRQWIFRYALALAREILGYVRGKYTTVPIPDSEAQLNQQDLLTDARDEKKMLIDQLRDMLDATSRQKQLEMKANEAEYLQKTLHGVPMLIYIG